MNIAINAMIYIGTVLMVVNIGSYLRFERYVKKIGGWEKERRILYVPIVLLALFLIGYLFIGIAGEPDLVMAGIMFGGSIFVLVILIVMWRVTKQIHANEQLGAALRAAEQANEAKSVFLANMSHDIRTPLNAILGYTALAKGREMTSEEAQEYFAKIGTAGTRLLELVNDVLEMRRIESGKTELVEEPTDLVRIMDDLRDLFEAQMAQKQLEFRVEVQAENQYVLCDRHKLNMILLNLVSNAWKFTEQSGSVTVSLKENDGSEDETTADRDVRWYELRVADTGIGMTAEFAAKVFDVFERERTTTSSGIQGTGLGMAIAKNLVELMHGTIRVDTAPGEGTEFTVQLPLQACSEEEAVSAGHACTPIQSEKGIPFEDAGEKHTGSDASPVNIPTTWVLLAEDVAVNREIAAMMLMQLGYEVETAENGKEAVEKIAHAEPGHFAAVLMDIQMPVMDGYQATAAIRALEDPVRAGVPVIALTANAFAEDRKRAEEAGMDGHVAKPIDPEQLRKALEIVCDRF